MTEEYRHIYEMGRVALYRLEVEGTRFIFGVVYGATGGHDDTEAAQKTDDIVQVLQKEVDEEQDVPTFFIGDFNCDPADLPTMQDLMNDRAWTDIGAVASIWGGGITLRLASPPMPRRRIGEISPSLMLRCCPWSGALRWKV